MADLESYFKITDINKAIYDTIDDSQRIQHLILDLSPEAHLDRIFRPLENSRTRDNIKQREGKNQGASTARFMATHLCYQTRAGVQHHY